MQPILSDHPLLVFDTVTMQSWGGPIFIARVLGRNPSITRIVELGTGSGGLTLFMGMAILVRQGKILSMDINRLQGNMVEPFRRLGIVFEERDVLHPDTVERVKEFIEGYHSLIFCDNGLKKEELPLYAPLLKRDDIIMAHDWGSEIKQKDITPEVEANFIPYYQEEADGLKAQILSLKKKGAGIKNAERILKKMDEKGYRRRANK